MPSLPPPTRRRSFVADAIPLVLAAGATLATACGTARPPVSAVSMRDFAPPRVRGSSDVLTRYEIEKAGLASGSARDAVNRLRPELLRRRTPQIPGVPDEAFPVVYVDGQWHGSLEILQTIPASMVGEVRYLSATAAADWLGGTHHAGGVLAIRTRR